jgi:uncharacterized 2Fe-2S/4Fe-4S cluster protein (DUF4445 family)
MEAVAGAGFVVDAPCGGEGTCGKCRLKVLAGSQSPTPAETLALTSDQLDAGFRLACQTTVTRPMTVEMPPSLRQAVFHQILAATDDALPRVVDPAVRKSYVELPVPSRTDDTPDLLRLERVLEPLRLDLELLRQLPHRLRQQQFRGTAVMVDGQLIDFEPGDTSAELYALAVDIGTTTLVAQLLDLRSGQPLETVARLNPQTQHGDDVLSRILFVRQKPEGLDRLQQVLVGALNEMIAELTDRRGIQRQRVYEITLSGNTTMQQLLCGLDPRPLGEVPFVPAMGRSLMLRAAELGLDIHPCGRAILLPVIGGFVGGDTVAGILATGMLESAGPTLLVDIGTNGEIVLWADGQLTAASTAAGPAFEGARILHGMRGSTGAIEKVVFNGRLRINVIGNVAPLGICGSALIDLAAELLRHGLITPEGRLSSGGNVPESAPTDLVERLVSYEGQPAFQVASAEESGTGRPIVLTQRDIRELQLATGAIRAGIVILLTEAGRCPADLESVLVAGGFGNFIRRSNAQRIGLLPHAVPHQRIRYQGNASLAGAQMAALSQKARRLADDIARRTRHVDLGCNPQFSEAFGEAMIFPDE